ncbi:hypothetical protein [Roseovarius arcticus]|nr:hypothetical protein [Roseovarius arcticus]
MERISSTAEIAARTLEKLFEIDVSDVARDFEVGGVAIHNFVVEKILR